MKRTRGTARKANRGEQRATALLLLWRRRRALLALGSSREYQLPLVVVLLRVAFPLPSLLAMLLGSWGVRGGRRGESLMVRLCEVGKYALTMPNLCPDKKVMGEDDTVG